MNRLIYKALYGLLLICIVILSVHFRTGAGSDHLDFNFVAMSFRATIWFAALFVISLLLKPGIFMVRPSSSHIDRTFVIYSWPAFILLTLLSTLFSSVFFQVGVSALDVMDFLEVIGCFCLVLIIYNLLKANPTRVKGIMIALLCLPGVQILGVLFITEEFSKFLGVNSDYDLIWYFGYGHRFVGLLGNANAVAIQCCISLAILTIFLISPNKYSGFSSKLLKILLCFFACTVLLILFLTGVRAAILSLGVMSVVIFYFAPSKQKMWLFAFTSLAVTIVLIVGVESGMLNVLLERIGQSDGRFSIWWFYIKEIALNPIGYGLVFENAIDVTSVPTDAQYNVRLPPHNTFLHIGVYSGLLGIALSIVSLTAVLLLVRSIIRRGIHGLNTWYIGACIAWIGLVVNYFFGGLFYGDWLFAILTGVILAAETSANDSNGVALSPSPS